LALVGFGMVRRFLRIVGIGLGSYALLASAFATVFRMDTAGELGWILQVDVILGLALASAITLVRIPTLGAGTVRRHALTIFAAITAWVVVSGGLAWSHIEQHRLRSTLSLEQ
jgi:hypothetical protein